LACVNSSFDGRKSTRRFFCWVILFRRINRKRNNFRRKFYSTKKKKEKAQFRASGIYKSVQPGDSENEFSGIPLSSRVLSRRLSASGIGNLPGWFTQRENSGIAKNFMNQNRAPMSPRGPPVPQAAENISRRGVASPTLIVEGAPEEKPKSEEITVHHSRNTKNEKIWKCKTCVKENSGEILIVPIV